MGKKTKEEREDKEWAKRYILDPLTAPEPSQLDGPGSSFFNPRRSLSLNCKPKDIPINLQRRHTAGYPTPPHSASPDNTAFQIFHPKPISPGRRHSYLPPTDWAPADVVLRRSQSLNPSSQRQNDFERSQSLTVDSQLPNFELKSLQKTQTSNTTGTTTNTTNTNDATTTKSRVPRKPLRTEPEQVAETVQVAKVAQVAQVAKSAQLPQSPPQPEPDSRFQKASSNSPRATKARVGRKPPQTHHTQGTAEILGEILADRTSSYVNRPIVVTSVQVEKTPSPPTPVEKTTVSVGKPSSTIARAFSLTNKTREPKPPSLIEKLSISIEETTNWAESTLNLIDRTSKSAKTPHAIEKPVSTPVTVRRKDIPTTLATAQNKEVPTPITVPSKDAPTTPATVRSKEAPPTPSTARSFPLVHRRPSSSSEMSTYTADTRDPGAASERRSSTSTRKHRSSKSRSSRPQADLIDSLDPIGGVYHHGGPFDATLASVNKNKKSAPLEAVKDSNKEAIKATPREFIQDSLEKHVPLQGTANVPPGIPDLNGNVLYYEEGADLMREADAPGGAYKRWDGRDYHPDDLKGKGEPSYSIERALKENGSRRLRKHSSSFSNHGSAAGAYGYELQERFSDGTTPEDITPPPVPPKDGGSSKSGRVSVRRQSFSHGTSSGAEPWGDDSGAGYYGDDRNNGGGHLSRSGSTSRRLADGIKRRFGSLRRRS